MIAIAAALPTAALVAAPAHAGVPHGSHALVMLETSYTGITGDPRNAIVDGWWGHEGPRHTGATVYSINATDSDGHVTAASVAALKRTLGVGGQSDTFNLQIAFVRASADGSTERPRVTPGETAGQAFTWFSDSSIGTSLNGSTRPDDYVTFVSTDAQWQAFWRAGRPLEGFDDHLVLHDTNRAGSPVSVHPEGTSILNTWPAGTKISMVVYAATGDHVNGEPVVKVGPDGRAITSWLTFRTVADPSDPVRTSAGYQVLTTIPGEGSNLKPNGLPKHQPSGTPGSTSTGSDQSGSQSPSGGADPSTGTSPTSGSTSHVTRATHDSTSPVGEAARSGCTWAGVAAVLLALGALMLRGRRRRPPSGPAATSEPDRRPVPTPDRRP
jgi:hypothetical protein